MVFGFDAANRLALKVVLQTPSKSLDLTKLLLAAVRLVSPLVATLRDSPATVANKDLLHG